MSGSYPLQTPRPRHPPSSLHFEPSSFISSSVINTQMASPTLLYDLPSTSSMSPPTSPRSKGRVTSPSSPTFSGRSRAGRNGRPTPPPNARNRSTTPSGVAPSELEKFAEYCRAWYYNQDTESGRLMTQTLATLPPSHRAPFSRLQASVRSAYHRSINARRTAEFQAHLSATQPGGSLMPHSRADPNGSVAVKERYERMERFVKSWCTVGMPGTKPFFEALWAVFRLQVIPQKLGGAGRYRIDWEFDDAAFKEAAGKDFMLEAIDILKGVLAFEDVSSSKNSQSSRGIFPDSRAIHIRSHSQPLPSEQRSAAITAPTVQPKRARAPSDPFLDTPVLSHSDMTSQFSGNNSAAHSAWGSDGREEPRSPINEEHMPFSPRGELAFDDTDEEYMRIWTSPDLSNPELLELLKIFPPFISRRSLPRFPIPTSRHPDIEEGEDDGIEGKQIQFGTGSMWVSSRPRSSGWAGGWWTRFKLWWRRMFC